MIENTKRNRMGTVSFDGKFNGMRKAQNFITYPFHAWNQTTHATIQSDTRIGTIDLQTGEVRMSPARAGGSYCMHLALTTHVDKLSAEELLLYKGHILDSANGKAGTNGIVYTDNSGAVEVFAQVAA